MGVPRVKGGQCFPTPAPLRQCVRKQIVGRAQLAQFDKASRCFTGFAGFLRRRLSLVDSCASTHPVFRPPAALNATQRRKVKAINAMVMQIMKLSGYKKESWQWVELASIALYWASVGDPANFKDKKAITQKYFEVHRALLKKHLAKYSPKIQRAIKALMAYKVSHNIFEWGLNGGVLVKTKKSRFTATEALKYKMGKCSEASNVYIRQVRAFMNQAGVTERQVRISIMSYRDWKGLTDWMGHDFVRIEHLGSKRSLDLDPVFTINVKKKVPWGKLSRPATEMSRWITYIFNSSSRAEQEGFWNKHGAYLRKYTDYRWMKFVEVYRGGVRAMLGFQQASARSFFQKALKYLPSGSKHIATIRAHIARTYFQQGNFSRASREVKLGLKSDPKSGKALLWKALVLIMSRKYKEADAVSRKIDRNPLAVVTDIMFVASHYAKKSKSASRGVARLYRRIARACMDYALRYKGKYDGNPYLRAFLLKQGKYGQLKGMDAPSAMPLAGTRIRSWGELGFSGRYGKYYRRAVRDLTSPASYLNHTLSLGAWGTHKIQGALLAGYEFSASLPVVKERELFVEPFVGAEVGLNGDVNAMLALHAGAKLLLRIDRHSFGLKISGGAVTNLGRDVREIEPEGRVSLGYDVLLGYSGWRGRGGGGAVGYALGTEVGIRYDKKFKDAYGVLNMKFVF